MRTGICSHFSFNALTWANTGFLGYAGSGVVIVHRGGERLLLWSSCLYLFQKCSMAFSRNTNAFWLIFPLFPPEL